MHVRSVVLLLLAAAFVSPACGGVTSPSQNKQDTFSGVVQVGGITQFPNINIGSTGEFSIKITALSPNATTVVGMVWALGGNCEQALQQNNFATLNTPALVGSVFQKGAYCVAVYDVGAFTVAQNISIVVSHP